MKDIYDSFPYDELPSQQINNPDPDFGIELPDGPGKLEQIYNDVMDADPDHVAKVNQLAKTYGGPGNEVFIDSNIDSFEKLKNSPSAKFWEDLAKESPEVAKFLEVRKNMAMAKDDVESLGMFESFIRNQSNAYQLGEVGQLIKDININQAWQTLKTGKRSFEGEDQKQEFKRLQEELAKQMPEGISLTHFTQSIPFMTALARKGSTGAVLGGGVGATLGALVGNLPGAIAGAELGIKGGASFGANKELFEQMFADTFGDYVDLKDKEGKPIDPQLAAYGALAVASLDAGIGFVSLGPILRAFPNPGRFFSVFGGKEEVFKKLTTKLAIKNAVKDYLISVAGGTAVMTGIAANEVLGRRAIEGISNQEFQEVSWSEDVKKVLGVIPGAMQIMVPFALPGLVYKGYKNVNIYKAIEETKAAYLEKGKLLLKQKTRERDPEGHQQLVENIVKNTLHENIYIPADEWEEYWKGKGIPVEQVNKELDIEDQYKAAKESGEKISIPFALWQGKTLGSEHYDGLADSIVTDPEAPTKKQLKESEKEQEVYFQTILKQADSIIEKMGRMEEREGQVKAGRDAAYNAFMEEINKAAIPVEFRGPQMTSKNGKPTGKLAQWENVKKNSAKLFAARAVIASEQQGIPIEEWVQKNLPRFMTSDENPTPGELGLAQEKYSEQNAPEFYSKLEKTIEQKMGNFATPDQVRGILKEVKQEEVEWSGIEEFLKDKRKVSKAELLDYLRENQVRVEEVQKGPVENIKEIEKKFDEVQSLHEENGNNLEAVIAKYTKVLEGAGFDLIEARGMVTEIQGGGYEGKATKTALMQEEVLNKDQIKEIEDAEAKYRETGKELGRLDSIISKADNTKYSKFQTPGGENYREMLLTLPAPDQRIFTLEQNKTNGHWEIKDRNGKVHSWYYERDKADAVKSLDWYRRYKSDINGETFQSSHWDEKNVVTHMRLNDRIDANGKKVLFVEEIQRDVERQSGPKMPFSKNWHELALKKILSIAAREGYDKVAWTTGEMQKERYNLGSVVEKIVWAETTSERHIYVDIYTPQTVLGFAVKKEDGTAVGLAAFNGQKINDIVGKELGRRILTEKEGKAEGEGLKIGGAWATNLYDRMIPQFLNRYAKRFGGKVEKSEIGKTLTFNDFGKMSKSPLLNGGERIVFQYKDSDPSKKYEVYQETNENGDTRYTFYIDNASDGKFSSVEQLNEHLAKVTGLKAQSLEITPALRESILKEGQPLFQGDKTRIAGAINLNGERPEVIFFKATDASTLIHELSHSWIKDQFDFIKSGKASEADLKQWQAMKDWLKIADDQTELTSGPGSQQEQFARGFEAYLREGKAPTAGLAKVFAAFQKWMLKIYRTLKGLGPDYVPLNDEVRGFMDRMLATEDEIAMAKFSFDPGGDAVTSKMSDKAKEKIAKYEEQAHDRAFQILFKRQLKELTKKYKRKLKEERARAREDITNEVKEIAFYKASEEVKNEIGKNVREIAERFKKDELTPEEKLKFWMISEAYDYKSPTPFADAIIKGNTLEQEINQRLDKYMSKFADLKDSDRIREEAEKAVHNEKSAELIALQEHFLGAKVVKRNYANMTKAFAAMAKVKAIEQISQMPLKNAVKFRVFFTLEKNAAVRSAAAASKNNYESGFGIYDAKSNLIKKFKTEEEANAFQADKSDHAVKEIKGAKAHKHEQLMAHALATEAIKTDKWRVGAYLYMDKFLKSKREKFKNEQHFNQAAALALRFGFAHPEYEPLLKGEDLKTWADRMDKETDMVVIPEWLYDENIAKKFDDLTVDQSRDVIGSIANIRQIANAENKLFKLKKGQEIAGMIEELKAAAQAAVPENKRFKYEFEETQRLKAIRKLKRGGSAYLIDLERMAGICFKLDGYKEDGPWQRYLYDRVWEAGNVRSEMMNEMAKGLQDLFGKFDKTELAQMREQEYREEIQTNASLFKLIAIALNMGNEGNREKMFKNTPLGLDASVWTEDAIISMLEKNLSEKHWQLVQGIWNLIGTLWPESSKLHARITGFTPQKVSPRPFFIKTKEGKTIAMNGGYFPLKGDSREMEMLELDELKSNPLAFNKDPAWKIGTRKGHLQMRTNAQYPLELEVGRVIKHISDVVQDIAFRETAIDIRRILTNKEMKNTIVASLGPEGYDYMVNWLRVVALGSPKSELGMSWLATVVRTMRNKATAAYLLLKPTIIIENAANLFLYGGAKEDFNHADALSALWKNGVLDYFPSLATNPKDFLKFRDEIHKLSSFMRDRSRNPDFLLRELAEDAIFGKGVVSKIREVSVGILAFSDDFLGNLMWKAEYDKILNQTGDQKKAIREADRLIDNTLGSGRITDVAAILRSDEYKKSLAMFYSFMNIQYNRYLKEYRIQRNPETRDSLRLVGYVGGMILFLSASAGLSGKFVHHKEDKKENPITRWTRENIAFGAGFFPGGRELFTLALDRSLDLQTYGYRPTPLIDVVNTGKTLVDKMIDLKKGKTTLPDTLEAATKAAAVGFGYPDQLNIMFWNAEKIFLEGKSADLPIDLYKHKRRK